MDSLRNVNPKTLFRQNLRALSSSSISPSLKEQLREITTEFQLSLRAGEITLLSQKWYVTHSGLLKIAHNRTCHAIQTEVQEKLCNTSENKWIFLATVYPAAGSPGFTGYGDADPTNVAASMHGCELRIAETRAVNRALRKAYGVGICSVEELGTADQAAFPPKLPVNGSHRQTHWARLAFGTNCVA